MRYFGVFKKCSLQFIVYVLLFIGYLYLFEDEVYSCVGDLRGFCIFPGYDSFNVRFEFLYFLFGGFILVKLEEFRSKAIEGFYKYWLMAILLPYVVKLWIIHVQGGWDLYGISETLFTAFFFVFVFFLIVLRFRCDEEKIAPVEEIIESPSPVFKNKIEFDKNDSGSKYLFLRNEELAELVKRVVGQESTPNIKAILRGDDGTYIVSFDTSSFPVSAYEGLIKKDWSVLVNSVGDYSDVDSVEWYAERGVNGLCFDLSMSRADMSQNYPFPFGGSLLMQKNLKMPVGIAANNGAVVDLDLSAVSHLLVAGQTNSGKSVVVNSMIYSILKKKEAGLDVDLCLVDPKIVEFAFFSGVDGVKVINKAVDVVAVLDSIYIETKNRLEELNKKKVKKIQEYHEMGYRMPYKVIVIDEYGDIMTNPDINKRAFEDSVVRLAQIARAVGIHLILSTQRPSADIISTRIKDNIPGVIGLRTSSSHASGVIMQERVGLEKIKNIGEGYFRDPAKGPIRFRSFYLSNEQISSFVDSLKVNDSGNDVYSYVTDIIIGNGGYDNRVSIERLFSERGHSRKIAREFLNVVKGDNILEYDSKRRFNVLLSKELLLEKVDLLRNR